MKRGQIAFAALAVAVAGIAYYYWVNPAEASIVPKCLFRQLTGWSCPGCGMQRFLHAFLHGRFVEAISYNYMLVFLLPYTLLFAIERLLLQGETQRKWRNVLEGKAMTYACCIMAPAWFIVRNILNI
jgi:hypothetical protein